MASVRVGSFRPAGQRTGGPEELQTTLARAGEEGGDDESAMAAVGEFRSLLTASPKQLPREDAWNR